MMPLGCVGIFRHPRRLIIYDRSLYSHYDVTPHLSLLPGWGYFYALYYSYHDYDLNHSHIDKLEKEH